MEAIENGVQVSRDELIDVIENGRVEELEEILEAFDFSDSSPAAPGSKNEAGHRLATQLLEYAYIKAKRTGIDPALGATLVRYLAMSVEIFPFLGSFNRMCESADLDDSSFPISLRNAMSGNCYTRSIGKQINELSEEQFISLCKFAMSGSTPALNKRFNSPILAYIYEHKIIDEDSIFALMYFHLREVEEMSGLAQLLRHLANSDDKETED